MPSKKPAKAPVPFAAGKPGKPMRAAAPKAPAKKAAKRG